VTARQQTGTADPGDLSARVGQRRRELKLTRQEVAARAGMSVPYLAYLENHPARPTVAALRQLALALQTTPESLLGAGTGRPPGSGGRGPRPVLRTLAPDECYDLMAAGGIGRVVFDTADGPVVFPVNYAMAGHLVVLRTGADTELAARLDCPVGFEVDRLDEALSQGWSVLINGRAARVTKEEQVRRLEARTGLQPWAGGARDVYVQITPYRISGRRIC
jgi:nitroimidazol reductase NimA-like FMN-containing flavoprotein (pyridoxamine 5'-phosphate oxidase superfamily)/DNA-binding transcriptional regulator YiaG